MTSSQCQKQLSRRYLLQGSAALAATSLLPGCNSGPGQSELSQTITFTPPASPVAYGSSPITLSAVATSALTVVFSVVSGPATISGATLTITGVGTVVVAASQPGNSLYAAAPTVTQSITVNNPNAQPVPSGTLTPATIMVTAPATAITIPNGFAGLSWEKSELTDPTYLFSSANTSLVGLYKTLAPNGSILRLGGNSTDGFVWTPNGAGKTNKQIAPADVAQLATFLQATGWKCLYAVDLGGSAPSPLPGSATPTTPALDAAEVVYVTSKLGSYLVGIEIGNEPDLYGNSGNPYYGDNPPWSLSQYETVWSQYRSTILASTPTAVVTGPADADTETTWTIPFAQAEGSSIQLLTQHYYRTNPLTNPTAASLLTPDTYLTGTVLPELKAAATAAGIPFGITECNSVSDAGVAGVSNTYASALWIIDFIFNCAQGGAVQCNFTGGSNQNYYSPIQDNLGVVLTTTPSPDYYGLMLFNMGGIGTLYPTTVSAGSLNVTAYAVYTATGGINVFILNKDASTPNLQVTVQVPQTINNAKIVEMTQSTAGAAPSITATSGVTIQGATVASTGAFTPNPDYVVQPSGNQVTCYVPALSVILLQLS
jgi:hypothetical protein